MRWTSIVAIYSLFWVLSAFLVLPLGIKSHDDTNASLVPGQVSSAPVNFSPRRIMRRATVLGAILFSLFYLNYVNGWITTRDLDVTGGPPEFYNRRS